MHPPGSVANRRGGAYILHEVPEGGDRQNPVRPEAQRMAQLQLCEPLDACPELRRGLVFLFFVRLAPLGFRAAAGGCPLTRALAALSGRANVRPSFGCERRSLPPASEVGGGTWHAHERRAALEEK